MSGLAKRCGVSTVVLAAGISLRMGSPKQLLRISGETVLERTLKSVRNLDYEQGMGTSLRTGLPALDTKLSAWRSAPKARKKLF